MTKQQLYEALKRSRAIFAGTDELSKEMVSSQQAAAAYGYLERAVEEYTRDNKISEYAEMRKLARHGIRY